jgi:hypothetical protein
VWAEVPFFKILQEAKEKGRERGGAREGLRQFYSHTTVGSKYKPNV